MASPLPPCITAHDLLKATAVAIMIVDHVGSYFFPENLWLRAVGRASAPIWLFLIGHARGRAVPANLLLAGAGLVGANALAGLPLLPLPVLFTIAATRLALGRVTRAFLKDNDREKMGIVLAGLALLALPTSAVAEYGSLGLLFALMGTLVRDGVRGATLAATGAAGLVAYCAWNHIVFAFPLAEAALAAVAVAGALALLARFRAGTLPALDARLPRPLSALLRLGGRRTLEIYVAHLLVFKAAAWALSTGPFVSP
ncbi:MAG TPA: hypothetical protein DDX54_00860 [Rhodospirillaceae bacterium]|jgi:hypothetical protein|nr:hypothetical protein [Rhodospirillaceae bacterium]